MTDYFCLFELDIFIDYFWGFSNFCRYYTRSQTGKSIRYRLTLKSLNVPTFFQNLQEVFNMQGALDPTNMSPTMADDQSFRIITWQHPIERATPISHLGMPWIALWVKSYEPSPIPRFKMKVEGMEIWNFLPYTNTFIMIKNPPFLQIHKVKP